MSEMSGYFLCYCFAAVTFWLSWRSPLARAPAPINGVYSQEGPFNAIKVLFFALILNLRKISSARRKEKAGDEGKQQKGPDGGGLGKQAYSDLNAMESPQPFSSHPSAFDAVFFSGSDLAASTTFVVAMERRQDGRCNSVAYLKVGDVLLRAHWLPDTNIASDSNDSFRGGGISISPAEPMRRWRVSFVGDMVEAAAGTRYEGCEIEGVFACDDPCFNYDTDMDPWTTARAFAKEIWNQQYFKDLEKAHQTHYEQLGRFSGRVRVPGLTGVDEGRRIHAVSFRDHSFGNKRDWKLMHRYVFHHVFLPNGWKAVIGVVCQPSTCTSLECGFVSLPNGNLHPIQSCDLKLWEHGEGGHPPKDYAFSIVAGDERYDVQVLIESEAVHFYGSERECRMTERFARYVVDGADGAGICEWQYRNTAAVK